MLSNIVLKFFSFTSLGILVSCSSFLNQSPYPTSLLWSTDLLLLKVVLKVSKLNLVKS